MMDEDLEKTRGFSFFVGISIVGHVVALLLILIFNPTPTNAKFQKSGVRVGVKFASKQLTKTPSQPKKKSVTVSTPKKTRPKPKKTKVVPQKKTVVPPQPAPSKPIYVPKKLIPPKLTTTNLQPRSRQKTKSTIKPLQKRTPAGPLPKLQAKLSKKALPKPQLSPPPLITKKLPKTQPLPLPKRLPSASVPKFPTKPKKYVPPKIENLVKLPKIPKGLEQISSLPEQPLKTPLNSKSTQNEEPLNKIKLPTTPKPTKIIEKIEEPPTAEKALLTPQTAKIEKSPKAAPPKLRQKPATPLKPLSQGSSSKRVLRPGLERFKLQQAQAAYNAQIYQAVNKNFYAPENYQDLNIRIEITIGRQGELLQYKVMQTSGVEAFDLTAINAVKTTRLPPLPAEISKNPPYIVMLKF